MPGGKHEAVAVGPDRIVRVEPQEPLPEDVGGGGHVHWRAGVAGVGRLDGVHAERADRVDGQLFDRRRFAGHRKTNRDGHD